MKKPITIFIICLALMLLAAVISTLCIFGANDQYFINLIEMVKTNITVVSTVVSLGVGVLEYVYLLFKEKEIPKLRSLRLGIILFTGSFLYQCVSDIFPSARKEAGGYFLLFVTVLFYLYMEYVKNKMNSNTSPSETAHISNEPENTPVDIALAKYAKRKIRSCHEAITSIQLYRVVKNEDTQKISYDIEYLDSGHRNDPSLNAVLNTQLIISKEDQELLKPFLEAFEQYLSAQDQNAQKTIQGTMQVLSEKHIEKLKSALTSHISTVSDITIEDCCSSRLILTYLSCLDRVGKENAGDYVGVHCKSLNVCSGQGDADEINKQLFSKFRTGLLGALLMKTRPYVFYYEREHNNAKVDRQYISFLLGQENSHNSYLVLITAKQQTAADSILYSLLNAIKVINEDCARIYSKQEVKQYAKT